MSKNDALASVDAVLAAPACAAPRLRRWRQLFLAASPAGLESTVRFWRQSSMNYFPWLAVYVQGRDSDDKCLKFNHSAGYGCSASRDCAKQHRCLICNERDHGAFSRDRPCKELQELDAELARHLREDFRFLSAIVDADIESKQRLPAAAAATAAATTTAATTAAHSPTSPHAAATPPLRIPTSVAPWARPTTAAAPVGVPAPPPPQPTTTAAAVVVVAAAAPAAAASVVAAALPSAAPPLPPSPPPPAPAPAPAEEETLILTKGGDSILEMALKISLDQNYIIAETERSTVIRGNLIYGGGLVVSPVAVKLWHRNSLQSKRDQQISLDLRRDIEALQVAGDYAVKMIHQPIADFVLRGSQFHAVIMEYCEWTLGQYVATEGPLSAAAICYLSQQLVLAYRSLHQHNVCHRDVKPENILLKKQAGSPFPLVRLCDFGCSRRISAGSSTMSTKVFTFETDKRRYWQAPEVALTNEEEVDYRSSIDMWGLGCVLYFVGTGGSAPFASPAQARATSSAAEHDRLLRAHQLHEKQPLLFDLVLRLTQHDPAARISAADAATHFCLWAPHTVLSFVADRVDDAHECARSAWKSLDPSSAEVVGDNWLLRLPPQTQRHIQDHRRSENLAPFSERELRSVTVLLRQLRNLVRHPPPYLTVEYQGGLERTVIAQFPRLLPKIWDALRLHGEFSATPSGVISFSWRT